MLELFYVATALHLSAYGSHIALALLKRNTPLTRLVLLGVLPVISVAMSLSGPGYLGWFTYWRAMFSELDHWLSWPNLLVTFGFWFGTHFQFLAAIGLAVRLRVRASWLDDTLISVSYLGLLINILFFVAMATGD